MDDFKPWMQSDWYALGNLLIWSGFLVAGVWFARNLLRTIRAFQEQIGALLKMSITSAPAERPSASTIAARSLGEASPYWLPPSEVQIVTPPPPVERRPNRLATSWHGLVRWLQEPMGTSQQESYWRRMIHWLQAPAGS